MFRAVALLTCALVQNACGDDVEFQDTPLLSSIWKAMNDKDNDAIDRLFDSSSFAVTSRASDGRGPAFWAWEFQYTYGLGAIIAYGGDVLSEDEDLQGQTAVQMCEAPDCSKDTVLAEAKALVDDIKKRKEEREKAADDLDNDDDFDVDEGGSGGDDDDEF
mmetsp:Transcript_27359/g.43823  ORF Transcript_27359/g.43823 Transcript_27359/m.43823 type:complete len:161 (-) Transcript_27359:69-551(-)|eukprot:CAMPEP_0169101348 /NCGR_PEP_ID=MMETSP1015-20121227/21580_1 /TAXON_ID=342587 /ORGANISM="Karlodinium micrum, Strain CCMP2283" /LENGTH=160 /DNA_ID=CAMNT_0009162365 /DNA_START=64 /DNA_END=546 /DNA_ORIENTATION=+